MGKPYVWGASGPSSFDCSGFTSYVYKNFGIYLDHYTGSQYSVGKPVNKSELVPGDLVFFNTTGNISHVGIYTGGGQFIHASSGSGKVTVSNLSGSYYVSRYAGARRMF
ncbi:C40 family peptidase [Bacteroidales bacterium MSK.15.36]|nr:C40 family peptidase [Bacteroidales bacterium MSK.15.36]